MIDKYLKKLLKYRFVFFWAVVLILFGYTMYRLQALSQPTIDRDYIMNQQTAKTSEIKIDPELQNELENLVDTKVNTSPKSLGHPDPFNP